MEMIKSWQKQIDSFDKLKIEEAKELYTKAINSSDKKLRKLYLDKVILGTMYVINNYIERNDLKILQGSQYDLDDIQSAFTEIWIRKIQNGELLNVDKYSSMFTMKFFNEVYTNLAGDEIIVNEQINVNTEHFIDLFYAFIKLKNSGMNFNFNDLMNISMNEKRYYFQKVSYRQEDSILIMMLEGMYNNLNFDKTEDLDITRHKIKEFLRLFINNGLFDKLLDDVVVDDQIENIFNNIIYEKFFDDVDSVLTDERTRLVIHQRYGLDGENSKTYDEIKRNFGVSRERIRQIEAKALKNLRKSPKMEKYDNWED